MMDLSSIAFRNDVVVLMQILRLVFKHVFVGALAVEAFIESVLRPHPLFIFPYRLCFDVELEQMIIGLESSSLNAEIVEAQQLGVSAQRKQMRKMKVERVERLQEEMEELQGQLEETTEILTGGETIEDDDSLLDEFEELMKDDEEEELAAPVTSQTVAQTTTAKKQAVEEEEEDDELRTLALLEKSMRGIMSDLEEAPKTAPKIPKKTEKKAVAQGASEDDELFAKLEAEMMG